MCNSFWGSKSGVLGVFGRSDAGFAGNAGITWPKLFIFQKNYRVLGKHTRNTRKRLGASWSLMRQRLEGYGFRSKMPPTNRGEEHGLRLNLGAAHCLYEQYRQSYAGFMTINHEARIGPCGPRPRGAPGAGGGASAGGGGAGPRSGWKR